MRAIRALIVLSLALAPASPAILRSARPAPGPAIPDSTLLELGLKGSEPMAVPAGDWLLAQRAGEDGFVPRGARAAAVRQAERLGRRAGRVAPGLASAPWESLGPTNIGGRVSEVAVDPTRGTAAQDVGGERRVVNSIVYAATSSAGVWRSTDAGVTWSRTWPDDVAQAMGAVAVASDGMVYAGTGEPNPGGGSTVWGGDGMYRSSDGGDTWEHVGLGTSGAIGRIAVDPVEPKTLFVAAAGDLFVPGGERGLYRTTDGGDTWEQVLAGENETTGAVDVAVDPVDPDTILVAMWDHVRTRTHRVYGGEGSGVWRSTDGGDTWTEVSLPTTLPPEEIGRIGVAFAPSDPSRAYAIIANRLNGTGVGLYRSNDGGSTWANTGAPVGGVVGLSQSSYGWWFGKLWVDPLNADRLFVAGLELMESTNGGSSLVPHSASTAGVVTGANQALVHADQHGMAWDPHNPGRVYLANDGGIYISDAGATVGSWRGAAVQGWTQHYSVDVSEQDPGRVVSGLQDNMCQRNYHAGPAGHPHTWNKYGLCGDGLQTLVKPSNGNIIYGCAQYGANCSRTLEDGTAFEFLGGFPGGRAGWWVPIVFDPQDDDVMYAGTTVVSRSTNGGMSWSAISPDLSGDPPQLDPNTGYRIYGTITSVAVSATDADVIMAGTDTGFVWRTEDGGTSWERLSDNDNGNGDETDDDDLIDEWVSSVRIDPADPAVAYVTYSGFRSGSDEPHVVRTADGGITWDDISGDLPNAPVNDLEVAGGDLVVGTDVGVFLSEDGGASWLRVGTGLPYAPVLDLRYHAGTESLTVSTFGFGIQRVQL